MFNSKLHINWPRIRCTEFFSLAAQVIFRLVDFALYTNVQIDFQFKEYIVPAPPSTHKTLYTCRHTDIPTLSMKRKGKMSVLFFTLVVAQRIHFNFVAHCLFSLRQANQTVFFAQLFLLAENCSGDKNTK